MAMGSIQFLGVVGLRVLGFFWLLAGNCSQILEMPQLRAMWRFPLWLPASSQSAKERDSCKMGPVRFCNIITHTSLPLSYTVDKKQVVGPVHTQEGFIQRLEH